MNRIVIDQVSRTYENQRGECIEALHDVSFQVEDGELVCLLGPTGCGKTTLLRLIAGLELPDSGRITLEGEPVTGIRPDVTLLFQQYSLFPWRTVQENVVFGLEMKGVARADRVTTAREVLALTGLSGFEKTYPHELSGGMQQRTALARALAYAPRLLLMDEPFGALDDRTRHRLQAELLALRQRSGQSILFVTHAIDEAVFLADRIVILRDRPGSIETVLTVDVTRPRDRQSAEFVALHLKVRAILERIIEQTEI